MGVYRRADCKTYWMTLMIDGQRVRQDTGVPQRKVAEEIFAAWQVHIARTVVWGASTDAEPYRP
jgi:hypothetical protein